VSVASKLQIKPGQSVAVIDRPGEVDLELPPDSAHEPDPATADAVIVFITNREQLDARNASWSRNRTPRSLSRPAPGWPA
jgi:hypothetical protein